MKIKHFQIAALTGLMAFLQILPFTTDNIKKVQKPLPMRLQKQRVLK